MPPVRLLARGEPGSEQVLNRPVVDLLTGSGYAANGADFAGFAKPADIPEIPEIPDVSGLATTASVSALEASVASAATAGDAAVTSALTTAMNRRTRRGQSLRPPTLKRVARVQTDAPTGWAVSGVPARATLASDTANVRSSLLTPAASLRVTNNNYAGTANLDLALSPTVNATGALVYVRYRVNDPAGLGTMSLYLRSGGSFTNYVNRQVFDPTSYYTLDGSWYEVWLPVGDFTVTGSPTLAAVDMVRLAVTWTAANVTASVTVDEIALYTPAARTPRHCITLDDGGTADYAYAVALAARNLPATFYIVPTLVGTANYVTLSQLKQIRDLGHLIANHSWAHLMWKTTGLTLQQRIDEFERAAEWLVDAGFADGARHFAQPGGSIEADPTTQEFYGKYANTWRFTATQSLVSPPNSRGVLWTQAFDNAANATAALNRSIAGKGDTLIGIHSWSGTLAGHTAYLDAVAAARDAGQVEVVTVDAL